jgi:dimethylglycine dehydrogenase
VNPELSDVGSCMMLDLCGDLIEAEVIAPSPYDPEYGLMRA